MVICHKKIEKKQLVYELNLLTRISMESRVMESLADMVIVRLPFVRFSHSHLDPQLNDENPAKRITAKIPPIDFPPNQPKSDDLPCYIP